MWLTILFDSSCEKESHPSTLLPLNKGKSFQQKLTTMKIGIFGTGGVGRTIAAKLAGAGHEVMIGTRDVQATLGKSEKGPMGGAPFKEWQAENPAVKLATHAEAAEFGELLVNATNGGGTLDVLRLAGEGRLGSKVLLDIANPLDFSKGMPPTLTICNDDSLGETIQREFPRLRVVKGLNTLTASLMLEPGRLSETTNLFICGNDQDAKSDVRELLASFGWKTQDIIDLGDITMARGTEQILPIWVRLWGALGTPMFNFKIVQAGGASA
jgi:8-hydroxy-5-deazaflavin:NADPH oxidoreductase